MSPARKLPNSRPPFHQSTVKNCKSSLSQQRYCLSGKKTSMRIWIRPRFINTFCYSSVFARLILVLCVFLLDLRVNNINNKVFQKNAASWLAVEQNYIPWKLIVGNSIRADFIERKFYRNHSLWIDVQARFCNCEMLSWAWVRWSKTISEELIYPRIGSLCKLQVSFLISIWRLLPSYFSKTVFSGVSSEGSSLHSLSCNWEKQD